jgi:uncharacterized protein with von Willebrand factor type A (vWA) domain
LTKKNYLLKIRENSSIRKLLNQPSLVPYGIRNRIFEILAYELYNDQCYEIKDWEIFQQKLGTFSIVFQVLQRSDQWEELKQVCTGDEALTSIILSKILPLIYKAMLEFNVEHHSDNDKLIFDTVIDMYKKSIILTLKLWGREIGILEEIPDSESKSIDNELEFDINEKDINSTKKTEENLADEIISVMKKVSEDSLVDDFVQNLLLKDEINNLTKWLKQNKEVLDLLTSLYPGRLWDYSILNLKKQYFANLTRYSKFIEEVKDLNKIIELLGMIELEEGQKKLEIAPKGKSEVFGITRSGKIQRVLPIELLKLLKPQTKNLFYAKLNERALLSYQLRGKYWLGGPPKKRRRGPVVALVDTSGSMHGSPEHLAKALILAITKRMIKEKRAVKVILFSSINQTVEIELSETKKMANEFLNFLYQTFSGGTDFNTALEAGLQSLKQKKYTAADLLFISDGLSQITNQNLLQDLENWKKTHEARVFTIVVGNNKAGGLDKISDYIHMLSMTKNWNMNESPGKLVNLIALRKSQLD